jgi:hypothetical protein
MAAAHRVDKFMSHTPRKRRIPVAADHGESTIVLKDILVTTVARSSATTIDTLRKQDDQIRMVGIAKSMNTIKVTVGGIE